MDRGGPNILDIANLKPPNIPSGYVGGILIIIVIVALLWSSVYTVGPEEAGIVEIADIPHA